MLSNINSDAVDDARRLLMLLCFASRPLTVQEVIEGLAVELTIPMRLNTDRRLASQDDLHYICPGFIDIGLEPDDRSEAVYNKDHPVTVRIAHYSVQEYLESGRITKPKIMLFALDHPMGQTELAQICLTYLLAPGISERKLNATVLREFPLAHYAAMYWPQHYTNARNADPRL